MSRPNAPINIDSSIISVTDKNCASTCAYSFNYNTSACNVYNKRTHLEIPYDAPSGTYPAKYNGVNYKVDRIHIIQPSLHKYDGQKADAELLAYHSSSDGKNLIVAIPIVIGSNVGKTSSEIIHAILQNIPNNTDTAGRTVNTITNFNLGNLVPSEPFFMYTGRHLYTPYTGFYNYIVYHKSHGIQVSSALLNNLTQASTTKIDTTTAPVPYPTNQTLFYNKRGANKTAGQGEIYIKCRPTGEDGTVLYQQNSSFFGGTPDTTMPNKGIDFTDLQNNETFQKVIQIMIAMAFVLVVFFIGYFVIVKIMNRNNGTGAGASSTTTG